MKLKLSLTEQLLLICIIIVSVIIVSLGIVLPKTLLPIYEENIYNKLKQPLVFLGDQNDFTNSDITNDTDIAYIYIDNSTDNIRISDNLENIIDMEEVISILDYMTEKQGKFIYNKKLYYYNSSNNKFETKIALTNDKYVNQMKKDIFLTMFFVIGITLALISLIVFVWSNSLVNRIKKLKEKIDNIDNDNYIYNINKNYYDELYLLDLSLANMKKYLKEQEEYKNQIYQNISHDFKTPITVIKSYIEAVDDKVETENNAFIIIKEQISKLETKVHSLLYLNKLNYIKEKKENMNVLHDVSITINNAVEKFKHSRNNVVFVLDIDKKNTIFRGTPDMWEAIIDNILNNFMRYAKEKIKITVKSGKIILYNDGPNIDENILNNAFTPYEKGINGVFGLGLSIVKKSLIFLNYDITVENIKNGVKFTIK